MVLNGSVSMQKRLLVKRSNHPPVAVARQHLKKNVNINCVELNVQLIIDS